MQMISSYQRNFGVKMQVRPNDILCPMGFDPWLSGSVPAGT